MKKNIYVFLLFYLLLGCNSKSGKAILTYHATRQDFTVQVEAEGVLEAIKAQVLPAPHIWADMQVAYLAEEGTYINAGDVVFTLEAEELQNNYVNALDELQVAKADAEQRFAELELERLQYESQYKDALASMQSAKLQSSKLEFEPPKVREIKQLQIEQYELDAQQNMEKMEFLAAIQKEERAHQNLIIRQAQSRVDKFSQDLKKLSILAPVDGYVVHVRNRWSNEPVLVGDRAYPGRPIARIPDMSAMQVKLQVSETESQKLKLGQQATIYIPVLKDLNLTGKVSFVDKMAKPIRRRSKVKKVDVVVQADSTYPGMVPGLTAMCNIKVETIENALAVPLECIFEHDSVKIVYAKDGKKFKPYPIAQTGQDYDYTLIHGDFTNALELALLQPPEKNVDWPDTLTAYKLPVDSLKSDSTQTVPAADSTLTQLSDNRKISQTIE